MFKNYFKTAWRNLMKYKLYSFLNIAGLTVGILCSCLIFLYVTDELSYDNYSPLAERTYRINFFGKLGERDVNSAQTQAPAGPLFKTEMPQVEEMCRLRPNGRSIVKYENNSYNESNVLFADSSLFRVFNFPLLQGNAGNALTEPNTAVMSATMSKKYFGNSDAIGRTIKLDNDKLYKITAVMNDIPANTHFKCEIFLSMSSLEDSREDNWGSTNFATYLVLKPGANIDQLSKTMTQSFIKHFGAILKQYLNTNWEEFTKNGNYAKLELFPLQKIHLYSQVEDELDVNGDIKYVYIFSIVGILILTLACINFINLTTARASKRGKEVGIRKVAGATRSGLAKQFLGECFFISILSWILALALAWLLIPVFNQLSGKQFSSGDIFSVQFLPVSFLITVLTGLLAGLYPALFLSSFTPVKVLKGAKETSHSKSLLRNSLVIFQFFITTVLLVSAFVVYQQLQYIRNKNLGFNKEQVLVINDAYLLNNNVQAFKQRLLQSPAVSDVSVTNSLAVSKDNNSTSIIKGRNPSTENTVLINNIWTDA
ncbi:MAG: ABC transporter permease, partial [Panacibacter sp.]